MNGPDLELFISNQEIYNFYRERLTNICLAMITWNNLPKTCDSRYLELRLLTDGKACMLKPKGSEDWLSLGFTNNGDLDVYGYPTKILGVGYNSANIEPEDDGWMILYDNQTKVSLIPTIDLCARMLWKVHQIFNANLNHQISPYIVKTNARTKLSIKNLMNRVFGFQNVIEVSGKSFDPNDFTTLDTHVDFLGMELLDCLQVVWKWSLSVLGVTAETTKKERLLDGEIQLNHMENVISLNSRLRNRIEFCNKMNEKYGLNLSVNLCTQDTELIPYTVGMDYVSQELDRVNDEPRGRKSKMKKEDNNNG